MPKRIYLDDGEYRKDSALRKLESVSEPNKTYLLDFVKYIEAKPHKNANASARTVSRRLYEAIEIIGYLGKDAKLADEDDIQRIMGALNNSGRAKKSISQKQVTLRDFFKCLYKVRGRRNFPPLVARIDIINPAPTTRPEQLLSIEEMKQLISVAKSRRDKCILAMFTYFGCRLSELLNLHCKDVKLSADAMSWIHFEGKGEEGVNDRRDVPFPANSLVYPYILGYLEEYAPENPEAPLFMTSGYEKTHTDKLTGQQTRHEYQPMQLDDKNVYKLVKNARKRAVEKYGFTKRVHPHLFRKSSATLWSGYLTESGLKAMFGWVMSSRVLNTYILYKRDNLEQAIANATGAEYKKKTIPNPMLQSKHCPKCKQINGVMENLCYKCGTPLNSAKGLSKAIELTTNLAVQKEDMRKVRDRLALIEKTTLGSGTVFYPELMKKHIQKPNPQAHGKKLIEHTKRPKNIPIREYFAQMERGIMSKKNKEV